MHSDSMFIKGNSHLVCEDYALASGLSAIVCDGCSGASFSDVGARMLAFTVLKAISRLRYMDNKSCFGALVSAIYPQYIKELLEFNSTIGDATYVTAFAYQDKVKIAARGDGAIFIKRKDGLKEIIEVESYNNTPYYTSYDLDMQRKQLFLEAMQGSTTKVTSTIFDNGIDDVVIINRESKPDLSFEIDFQADSIEFVTVMSDGVCSFSKDGAPIGLSTVVKELTSYKNHAGEFVKRRFNGFERFCRAEGWSHYDDVSAAALYLGDK